MQMKLVSVNVGLPREVTFHGMKVVTGICKEPVPGRVRVRTLNLDGDRQADLTVHGGEDKAVYCYPLSHYQYWKKELADRGQGRDLPMGSFGENFTVDFATHFGGPDSRENDSRASASREKDSRGNDSRGNDSLQNDSRGHAARANESCKNGALPEDFVQIGDRFSVGTAEVVVTQPRLPCYKLGVKFQSDDMVKRFLVSRRMGFYFAVRREGEVGAGDELRLIAREPVAVPVSEIPRLYIAKAYSDGDVNIVRRALQLEALPESWKEYFRERLEGGRS